LEVTLLEGKLLLSSATGHDPPPHAVQCSEGHLLDLNGRISGYLTPVGSTLQMVSTKGSLEDYGRVKVTGTFTRTPDGMIRSGQMVLSSRAGSLDLTLLGTGRSPRRRNGPLNLQLATGHATGVYAHHCSKGSVLVALHPKRSHFVATVTTITHPVILLPPLLPVG
jgi:hypothetical protein